MRSWEPARHADLQFLSTLVDPHTVVEADALTVLAALEPGTPTGELVCWAWVVDPTATAALLVRHSHFGKWLPPGGRARPGEHPLDAAHRELHEETGITAELLRPAPVLIDTVTNLDPHGNTVHTFGVAHLFVASPHTPLASEPDQPAQWWPIDAPPEPRAAHHWARLTRAVARG